MDELPIRQIQQARRLEDLRRMGITPALPGSEGQQRALPQRVPEMSPSNPGMGTGQPPTGSVPPVADPGGEPVGGGVDAGEPSATTPEDSSAAPGTPDNNATDPDTPVSSPPDNTQTEETP